VPTTVYARVLARAAEYVGGEEQLALRLKVTPSYVALWIRGVANPPIDVFLAAVDIVSDHELGSRRTGDKESG
jgi:DNA-binding transcriptional regulator YdaS (Cro superfamily)